METKPLPCPFCGSDNCWTHEVWNRHTDHAQGYYVDCYDCGAMKGAMVYHNGTWDGFYKTETEAIESWNTRHERTCEVTYGEHGCPYCGECGCVLYSTSGYCPTCGTRVKEDTDAD